MQHSLFTHLPTEGYLGCLQLLTVINKAAINIHVQVSVWKYIFNSFGLISRSTAVGSYGKCMFSFVRNCQNDFQSSCTILYFHQQWVSSCCSTSSPASGAISVLDSTHFNRCVVVSWFNKADFFYLFLDLFSTNIYISNLIHHLLSIQVIERFSSVSVYISLLNPSLVKRDKEKICRTRIFRKCQLYVYWLFLKSKNRPPSLGSPCLLVIPKTHTKKCPYYFWTITIDFS